MARAKASPDPRQLVGGSIAVISEPPPAEAGALDPRIGPQSTWNVIAIDADALGKLQALMQANVIEGRSLDLSSARGAIRRSLTLYVAQRERWPVLAEWRSYAEKVAKAAETLRLVIGEPKRFTETTPEGEIITKFEEHSFSNDFWQYAAEIYADESVPVGRPQALDAWRTQIAPSALPQNLAKLAATASVVRNRISTRGRDKDGPDHRLAHALAGAWERATGKAPTDSRDINDGSQQGPFAEFVRIALAALPARARPSSDANITRLAVSYLKNRKTPRQSRQGKK